MMEKLDKDNIKAQAIKSLKWTGLSEIVSRALQPILTLILAHLLTPEDFGVVGVAMIVIGLGQIFQDFGLGKTLIQRETEIDKSANIVFWTNLAISIIIYLILFISAPSLSKFFHDERVTDVLRVLSLQIIFVSFITVHQALFQRNFQFKKLFFFRLSSAVVPGVVSIPLALLGYGVWSLVFGTLAGTIVQIFLFWRFSSWRPKFNYDFQLAKQLYGFSSWVALEAFLGWLILWGDSIVLGYFLGVKELGIYRVGVTFLIFIFGFFFNPILPITYSAFSRLQSNKEELRQLFLKMTKMIVSISLPLGLWLAILSQPFSTVIFGQKWEGIEMVIAILGIKYAIDWCVGHNPEVYRAIGKPDINSKLLIVAVLYYIPVYVFAAPYGLFVFCLARLAVAIIGMGLHIFVANKLLNLPYTYLFNCAKHSLIGSVISAIVMYSVVSLAETPVGLTGWVIMFASIALGVLTYILTLWLLDRSLVLQFFRVAIGGIIK